MKKSFKFLMIAVFISLAFVLSACSEGRLGVKAQANIGNEADYVAATEEDITALTTYVQDEESATDVTSYRMTMEMATSYGEAMSQTMKYNAVVSVLENDIKLAVKLDMSMTMAGETAKGSAKMYYDAGVMAMEMKGSAMTQEGIPSKIKITLPQGQSGEDFYLLEDLFNMDLGSMLDMMAEEVDFAAEGVEVKVNADETYTRYQINAEIEGVEGTMYLVFEQGKLTQYQMETEGVKVVLEAFDGEVEIPSFEGYTDFDYEDLFGM